MSLAAAGDRSAAAPVSTLRCDLLWGQRLASVAVPLAGPSLLNLVTLVVNLAASARLCRDCPIPAAAKHAGACDFLRCRSSGVLPVLASGRIGPLTMGRHRHYTRCRLAGVWLLAHRRTHSRLRSPITNHKGLQPRVRTPVRSTACGPLGWHRGPASASRPGHRRRRNIRPFRKDRARR
jgi:hypothetical protein